MVFYSLGFLFLLKFEYETLLNMIEHKDFMNNFVLANYSFIWPLVATQSLYTMIE